MGRYILLLSFKYSGSSALYLHLMDRLTGDFENVPGLCRKISMINDAKNEACQIYMFEEEKLLHAFMESSIALQVINHPIFSEAM